MKSSIKRLAADAFTVSVLDTDASLSLIPVRKGVYDKDVEVYVNGEVKRTYLSQVRVGQPWHTIEGSSSSDWFVCVSPIRLDYSRDSKNPTFIMGAINVLQAPSLDDYTPKPPTLPATKPKLLTSDSGSDVQDVDFK